MKYKVGDKVKIVSLQSEGLGCCMDVVGDIGEIIEYDSSNILKYKVKIEDGGSWWWEESNLELVKSYEDRPSTKFKKGDKVKVVGETRATGVNFEGIYTIKNPSDRTTDYRDGRKESYHVSLEEADGTPNEDCFELYIEPRNYRNMKPTDLIKVSIDGFEGEIPLGDLVSSQALIGRATGGYGKLFYIFLFKSIGGVDLSSVSGDTIHFSSQQKQALDYFFQPYYDEQKIKKEELHNLISNKQNELKELQDKLNQLES